jgi:hypothetical protein
MNPDDLDAMDESVPFAKNTLDSLLGIQHSEESYRYYFDCFVQAQRTLEVDGLCDQLKKNVPWKYHDFLNAPIAKDIPQVKQFKQQLLNTLKEGVLNYTGKSYYKFGDLTKQKNKKKTRFRDQDTTKTWG